MKFKGSNGSKIQLLSKGLIYFGSDESNGISYDGTDGWINAGADLNTTGSYRQNGTSIDKIYVTTSTDQNIEGLKTIINNPTGTSYDEAAFLIEPRTNQTTKALFGIGTGGTPLETDERFVVTTTSIAINNADLRFKGYSGSKIQLLSNGLIYFGSDASKNISRQGNQEGQFDSDWIRIGTDLNVVGNYYQNGSLFQQVFVTTYSSSGNQDILSQKTFKATPGSGWTNAALVINTPAATPADSNLLGAGVNNSPRFQVATSSVIISNANLQMPVDKKLNFGDGTNTNLYRDDTNNKLMTDGSFQVGGGTLTVLATGKVGIGTIAPKALLHVTDGGGNSSYGTPQLVLGSANNAGAFVGVGFGYPTGSNVAASIGLMTTNGAGTGMGDIVFNSRNSYSDGIAPSELMRITSAGNVGIGTNNPNNLLHLRENDVTVSRAGITIENSNDYPGSGYWSINTGNSSSALSGKLGFDHSVAGTILTLTKDGNVGIGTTSPGATLEVNGTIKATGTTSPSIQGTFIGSQTVNYGGSALTITSGGPVSTDGILVVFARTTTSGGGIAGWTDHMGSGTYPICYASGTGDAGVTFTMPVKKGDTWTINCAGVQYVWYSLGG